MPRDITPRRGFAGFRCCAGICLAVCALSTAVGCYTFPKPVVPTAPSSLNWLTQLVPSAAPQQPVNLEVLRPPEAAEVIHRGDLLELTVWDLYEPGRPQLAPLRVEPDGKLTPPLLPALSLQGLTLSEAEKLVSEQYQAAEILLEPRILVRRLETSQCPIQVIGAVQRPGTVKLNRDQAVVYHAIIAAGGLSPNAGHHLQLVRYAPNEVKETPVEQKEPDDQQEDAQEKSEKNPENRPEEKRVATLDTSLLRTPIQERWFDLTNPEECKELARIPLQEGDQITVKEEAAPIRISGQVKNPGSYPLPAAGRVDIVQALQLAGGPTITDLPLQLTLTRPIPGERGFDRKTFTLDPKQPTRDFPLAQPGDQLYLETTPRAKVERVVGGLRRKSAALSSSEP